MEEGSRAGIPIKASFPPLVLGVDTLNVVPARRGSMLLSGL